MLDYIMEHQLYIPFFVLAGFSFLYSHVMWVMKKPNRTEKYDEWKAEQEKEV